MFLGLRLGGAAGCCVASGCEAASLAVPSAGAAWVVSSVIGWPVSGSTLPIIEASGSLACSWEAGTALGDVARERVPSSGALVALTIEGITPADYVRGGAALERLWIAAQEAGLAVQLWSPVFLYALDETDLASLSESYVGELGELSVALRTAMGIAPSATMIMLLRVSDADAASVRSGRLPVESVLEHVGSVEPAGLGEVAGELQVDLGPDDHDVVMGALGQRSRRQGRRVDARDVGTEREGEPVPRRRVVVTEDGHGRALPTS